MCLSEITLTCLCRIMIVLVGYHSLAFVWVYMMDEEVLVGVLIINREWQSHSCVL